MMGYCSNSPMRCSHAKSMVLLKQAAPSCPLCGLSLVVSSSPDDSAMLTQRVLQLALMVIVILLFVLVYIYYANFV